MKLISIMAFSVATLILAGCQSATSSSGSSGPTITATATALAGTWTQKFTDTETSYTYVETDTYTFTLDTGSTTGGTYLYSRVEVETNTSVSPQTTNTDTYYRKGTWSVANGVLTLTRTHHSDDNTTWTAYSPVSVSTGLFLVVDNTLQLSVYTAQGTVSGLVGTWSLSSTSGSNSYQDFLTFNADKTYTASTYANGATEASDTQTGTWSTSGSNITIVFTDEGETYTNVIPYAIYGTKLVVGEGYTKGTTAKAVTRSVAPFSAQRHLTK